MKRKAYEEAGLSVTQPPPVRLMPAAETPANTQNSQVAITAAEAMHLKTEKSAGLMLFFVVHKKGYSIYLRLHLYLKLCPLAEIGYAASDT